MKQYISFRRIAPAAVFVITSYSIHYTKLYEIIPVGYVGVVVSYTGERGIDSSGSDYKHGELVDRDYRGVWKEPLMPGKYAFNTYAGKVVQVPTTNFILKWISNEGGEHRFDSNLKEVNLITKDAFEPSLPLSVVLHIDYRKAPYVIQRFGDRITSYNVCYTKLLRCFPIINM